MKELRIGFGRSIITPKESVPLGGYGNTSKRMSLNVRDELMATCTAITDAEGETVLLISLDIGNSSKEERIRAAVSEATGIVMDRIFVAATHTHSGPDVVSEMPCMIRWLDFCAEQTAAAAKEALADRAPAEVYIGKGKTERLNFVRHYLLSDGSYGGDNFGDFQNNTIVGHATPNDPQLQVIKFVRSGEKKDILMVNWQAHPTVTGGTDKTDISADFIGSTRQYLEEATGDLFVYFTGTAGNQNWKSRIVEEMLTTDCKEFGRLLGNYVLEAQKEMTKPETGCIRMRKQDYEGQINHTMEDKLEQAKEVQALFLATNRDEGNRLARQYGFSSVYHAGAVVRRSGYGKSKNITLTVCSMGEISFVAAPYEMFAAQGVYIKEHSPFPMTFVISCCNGTNSYMPTVQAYDYGCYESCNANFVRETGDKLAEEYVNMLKMLQ